MIILSHVAFVVLLLCATTAGVVFAQSNDSPEKILNRIAARIYDGEATDDDYRMCRELHDSAQSPTNKRICLHLAATYQRSIVKNPVQTLELLAPAMSLTDSVSEWKKFNRDILRSVGSGNEKAMLALSNLSKLEYCPVEGSHGPLAVEVAYALLMLGNNDQALELLDRVGQSNTDEVRVLAVECFGDYCAKYKAYEKARDAYGYGNDIIGRMRGNDYHYEKGDREFSNAERDLISRRLSQKRKDLEGLKEKKDDVDKISSMNFRAWGAAVAKVESLKIAAQFIICMIPDGRGGAFVGTEDHGVYHYDNSGAVKQYTDKDGLGDPNAYALAIDKLGRLWAGNLNSGVSVFNGKEWRNYDVVDGPIGERVFDIQTCPADGDVWIATSAGLTRYKIETDEWEHFTREDGLLEDQASSLAFKGDGTLIVGTQCHGLAVFNRDKNGGYKHVRNITVPERYGPGNCSPVPLDPFGNGLPTNQINQIIVAQNGDIWIATPTGLVKSNNNLTKMSYVRGRDYADKVRGLYGGAPNGWKECPKEVADELLPEDYITCISEDENGTIWIGTRQKGFMAIDPKTGRRGTGDRGSTGMADNYVSAILPMADNMPLIGLYIGGVIKPKEALTLQNDTSTKKNAQNSKSTKETRSQNKLSQHNHAPLPSPIKPPTVEELKAMYYELKNRKPEKNPPKIIALNDDWRTQGDWIDRYGRHSAVLCAQGGGGMDFFGGYLKREMQSAAWIGRNYSEKDDQLRRWVHWLESNDKRILQCLSLGGRKQADWDDHKEVYSMSKDGPHVYSTIKVPAGRYVMSFYFFNKDGHSSMNRMRDYILTVKTNKISQRLFEQLGNPNVDAEKDFFQVSSGEKLRIRDFWGGVYKRFYIDVAKDEYVTVRLDANYSFNTIISGIFFDPAGEMKPFAPLDATWPPPRNETNWAEVMEAPLEDVWWGALCLDRHLCRRDSHPVWFYQNARLSLHKLIRHFIRSDNNNPHCAIENVHPDDKTRLRPDVAKLLQSVQLFDWRDKVDYSSEMKYNSYWWQERTRLGRNNFHTAEWDEQKVQQFLKSKSNNQTW